MKRHSLAIFFLLISFAGAKGGEPRQPQSDKRALTKATVSTAIPKWVGASSKLPTSVPQHLLSLKPVGLHNAIHAAAPNTALNGTTIPAKH